MKILAIIVLFVLVVVAIFESLNNVKWGACGKCGTEIDITGRTKNEHGEYLCKSHSG